MAYTLLQHATDQDFEDWYATVLIPATIATDSYPTMSNPYTASLITIGNRTYDADKLGHLLDHLFELYPEALV